MWLVWYVSNFADEDLTPSNIKDGVTIYGVVGDYIWGWTILPSGWTIWNLLISDISLYNSYESWGGMLWTYYYEDSNIISWFALFHTYHTSLPHYYPKYYLFNISKSTWEIELSSIAWFDDNSTWQIPWTMTEYGIYEDVNWIYYIISWMWNSDTEKRIHILTYDKITYTISESHYYLTWWWFTWLEELSYLPVWYTTFTNPSPLPTDLYWSQFWNANFSWTWVWCRVPYITNT